MKLKRQIVVSTAVAILVPLSLAPATASPPGLRLTLSGPSTTYTNLYQVFRGRLSVLNQGIPNHRTDYLYPGVESSPIDIEIDGAVARPVRSNRDDGAFFAHLYFGSAGAHQVVAVANRGLPTEVRSDPITVTAVAPPVPVLKLTGYSLYRTSDGQVMVWVHLVGEPTDANGEDVPWFTPVDGRVAMTNFDDRCWSDTTCPFGEEDTQISAVTTDSQLGHFAVAIGPFRYGTTADLDPATACTYLRVSVAIHYVAAGVSHTLTTNDAPTLCV